MRQITDLSSKISLFNVTCYSVTEVLYMLKDIDKSIEYYSGRYGLFLLLFHILCNFLVIYNWCNQFRIRHTENCNFALCIKWGDVSVGIKSYEGARRFFFN